MYYFIAQAAGEQLFFVFMNHFKGYRQSCTESDDVQVDFCKGI